LIEQKVDSLKYCAQASEKLYEFAQAGTLQKEAIALLLATAAQLHKSRNNPG